MRLADSALRAASNADGAGTQIDDQPPEKAAMQVPEAEDPSASHAYAALDQVHATAALIAVGGNL